MPSKEVFVSFSTKDQPAAEALVDALEARGLTCWISCRDIPQGKLWADEIDRALMGARAFVVLISKASLESLQVPKEVGLAAGTRQILIPVRLDDSPLTGAFRYYLSECQWVDARQDFDAAVAGLADTLCRALHPDGTARGLPDSTPPDPVAPVSPAAPPAAPRRPGRGRLVPAAVLLVVVLGLAAFGLFRLRGSTPRTTPAPAATATPETAADETQQVILLKPSDTISVEDYEVAVTALEARLDNYFGADGYTLTREGSRLTFTAPLTAFGTEQVNTFFVGYFLRPNRPYLAGEGSDLLELPHARLTGAQVLTDTAELAGTPLEGCPVVVKVTPEASLQSEIQEFCRNNTAYTLKMDLETGADTTYQYEKVWAAADGSALYFSEESNDPRLGALMAMELQQPDFDLAFSAHIGSSVWWEDPADAGELPTGSGQTTLDQLDPLATIQAVYRPYEEGQYGQWYDFRSRMVQVLDRLGVRYALGTPNDDPYALALAMDDDRLNECFFQQLPDREFYLYGSNGEGFYGRVNFTAATDEAGHLVLTGTPAQDDYVLESWQEQLASWGQNTTLTLQDGSGNEVFTGHLEGEKAVLDGSLFTEDGTIPDQAGLLVGLLCDRDEENNLWSYTLDRTDCLYTGADFWDLDLGYPLQQLGLKTVQQDLTDLAAELWGSQSQVSVSFWSGLQIEVTRPCQGQTLTADQVGADLDAFFGDPVFQDARLTSRGCHWLFSYYDSQQSDVLVRVCLDNAHGAPAPGEKGAVVVWDSDFRTLAQQVTDTLNGKGWDLTLDDISG